MTPLSEGNGNRNKKPQGRPPPPFFPPPPLPSCESPTTCKDETYRGSRRPSPRNRRQMARKKRTSHQIIFNKIQKKGKQEEDDLLVYVTKKHPNTYPRTIIQNALENHRYLNNQTKWASSQSCSRKERITGNQLYEASRLYLMIALEIQETTRKPPPQTLTHSKDDLSY